MSRGRSGIGDPDPADRSDPVAVFFARERDEVRPQDADDLRWQRITHEAARQRRSRWLASVGGVAAAGLVAAALVWGTQGMPDPQHGEESAGVAVGPTGQVSSHGVETPTPSRPTTAAGPPPTAAEAVGGSISNAGDRHLFALGAGGCPAGPCPVVRGSTDNGATWRTLARFPQ